jgi:hypothetical protein
MKNTDIRIYFLCLIFFYNQLYWDKNNKHNAVFQHIPTEIDDVVISKKPSLLFEVSDEGKNGWIVFIMR